MTLSEFIREWTLALRIRRKCGIGVFDGATTPDMRKARARQAITEKKFTDPRWAAAFVDVYGEPLEIEA